MLNKEQIRLLGKWSYDPSELGFRAKELLKAYRNTPEGLKDRFILENKGIFEDLLEADPTGPSAATKSSPEALAPYMGAGLNAKLKDIDLSQEPSAVRVYDPSKKELNNKGLKRNAYDYYTAYTGKELEPENLAHFVKPEPITEYGLLKVLDRLPNENTQDYHLRIDVIARNLGYDIPDFPTPEEDISIRGQLAKDLMDQQILESRKLAMQDEDQGPAAFITSTLLPRTYEDVINNRVDSDGIDPRSLGLDAAENAAMFIPNPISYGAKVIKPIARIASKAGPLVKKIGNAVSYLGNNAIVPVSFEGLDASVYDENSNPRSEFMPGQAAIGTAVNATAPRALNIGLEGTGKMFSLIKGGEKPGAYKTAVENYSKFQDWRNNADLSDAYIGKARTIIRKSLDRDAATKSLRDIESSNVVSNRTEREALAASASEADRRLRSLGLSKEELEMARSLDHKYKFRDKLHNKENARIILDQTGEAVPVGMSAYVPKGKGITDIKVLRENIPVEESFVRNATEPREIDPFEINKAFYAYKPDRIPYDVEKKWQAYAAIVPGADAWLKNKAGRSNVVKQAGGALAGRFGATGDLSKTIDEYSLDPSGIPYESVPDTSYYPAGSAVRNDPYTSYYPADSAASKNPYIIKYILPASK